MTRTIGDPHEIWHRFSGRQIGYVGNNGTLDTDYNTSLANRTAAQGTGAFFNGSTNATSHADFDLAYDSTNSYTQGSTRGVYVVQAGDSLSSIAAALWGDASLWWKLAEVNGLTAESALPEGLPLIIPAGVVVHHNNALTYQPYDPLEVLGNTSPTTPKPAVRSGVGNCGGVGVIILAVIAIVVTIYAQPLADKAWMVFAKAIGIGAKAAAVAAPVVAGAAAGAAGSIVSQGVGVATGIQEKFSWNAVALAAIGGGVGGAGVGDKFASAAGAAKGTLLRTAIGAAANNVVTQGIGVAISAQSQFSWAGVAAASAGAWAGGQFNNWGGNVIAQRGASLIADAASRTLIEGSDFGDNILAALPNVIGSILGEGIGNAIGGACARRSEKPITVNAMPLEDLAPYAPEPLAELPEYTPLRIRPPAPTRRNEWERLYEQYGGASDFPVTFFDAIASLDAANDASLTYYSGGSQGGEPSITSDLQTLSRLRAGASVLRTASLGEFAGPLAAVLALETVFWSAAVAKHGAPLMIPEGHPAHPNSSIGRSTGAMAGGFGVTVRSQEEADLVDSLRAQGANSNVINTHLALLRVNRGDVGVRGGDLTGAVRRYADLVGSNRHWSWESDFTDRFTTIEQGAIRRSAIERGWVATVPYKSGTRYLNFEAAGLIQRVDYLPENLWRADPAVQVTWLNSRVPNGQPDGTVWHHSEIEGRMELVPWGIHNVYQHKGGQSPGHWAEQRPPRHRAEQ